MLTEVCSNFVIHFEGHPEILVRASGFNRAVEIAMNHINQNMKKTVSLSDLNRVDCL